MAIDLTKSDHDRLMRLPAPERARQVKAMMDATLQLQHRLATMRAQAIVEMRDSGMSFDAIGREMDVTRQQAHRLWKEAGDG